MTMYKPLCFTLAVAANLLSLPAVSWAGEAVYQSNFGRSRAEWSGRAGFGNSAPSIDENDNEKHKGKEVCGITTDGGLGSGLTLKPEIEVDPEKQYRITFELKTDTEKPVTYRIIRLPDGSEDEFGEDTRQWFATNTTPGDWVEVEAHFTPLTTQIGMEIGVGAEHDPAALKICNVKIEKVSK
jgi:hypothetical protein